MKIGILTKEFPPYVYGGAGVHVESLVNEFIKKYPVYVQCFGNQNFSKKNLTVKGYNSCENLITDNKKFAGAFEALCIALKIASKKPPVDLVHCHTWYTTYIGFLLKQLYNIPLIVTLHSIEPLRPWKQEQLGSSYHLSCWMEKTAIENADKIIAVSDDTKINILRCYNIYPSKVEVIYNGMNVQEIKPTKDNSVLLKYNINPKKPYILFVGRVTRQKGLIYLLNALQNIDKKIPVVIVAGAPDEKNIYRSTVNKIKKIRATGRQIIHVEDFIKHSDLSQFFSHAAVFVCPSIYEPFGMAALEAMACGIPVVASAVGGLPEFVVPEETGYLVTFKSVSEIDHEPRNPENFSFRLAKYINIVLNNPKKAKILGNRGRQIAVKNFSWQAAAKKTINLYQRVLKNGN